ncbi:MAG: hypothetical protein WC600_09605 [Desulfobaccales bacterium]
MMPQSVAFLLAAVCGLLGVVLLVWHPSPKSWIGVRTPWTFADREIWDISWMAGGVLLLVMAGAVLVTAFAFFVAVALLILISLLLPIYLYRRKYGTLLFWKDIGWIDYRPVVRCSHCGHTQKLEDDQHLERAICEVCGLSPRRL